MLITNKKLSGFTLLELIVVIAIIAILAVIAIPSFTKAINEAKSASIKANMKLAMQEIMKEQANNGGVVPGLQECAYLDSGVAIWDINDIFFSGFRLTHIPNIDNVPYSSPFDHIWNSNYEYTPCYPLLYQKYFDIIQKIASSGNFLTDINGYQFFILISGKDKFANYIYLPNYKLLCVDNQGQTKEYDITQRENFSLGAGDGEMYDNFSYLLQKLLQKKMDVCG